MTRTIVEAEAGGKYKYAIFKQHENRAVQSGDLTDNWISRRFSEVEYAGDHRWITTKGDKKKGQADVFTLVEGSYYIEAHALGYAVGSHRLRFIGNDQEVTKIVGMNTFSHKEESEQSIAYLCGIIKIGKETSFKLEHICKTPRGKEAQGRSNGNLVANDLEDELYAILKIVRFYP